MELIIVGGRLRKNKVYGLGLSFSASGVSISRDVFDLAACDTSKTCYAVFAKDREGRKYLSLSNAPSNSSFKTIFKTKGTAGQIQYTEVSRKRDGYVFNKDAFVEPTPIRALGKTWFLVSSHDERNAFLNAADELSRKFNETAM
jgi:hypothetical protein